MQRRHTFIRRVGTTLILALLLGAQAVSAGSISIQWDANTEHDVVGYRVFIGTKPGTYAQSIDVGNTTTFVFNGALDGQRYCFAVAAYSAGPLLGDKSVEVCTDASANQPPTLTNPGALTHPVGVALTLQLEGSDPESAPITYAAVGLPAGLSLNKNTGFISGTPTVATTSTVKATVSDGESTTTQTFTWKIAAGLPLAARLLRPSGSIGTTTPTFEWESVATATSYRLWVDDSSTTDPKVQIDLTPTQAGCATMGAVCQAKPGIVLAGGRASWSVRASNASGPGPWSGAMDFTVPDGKLPSVTIVAPTGSTTFSTGSATIALGGTATDDLAVTQVTWSNSRGGNGTATGTEAWAASIPLQAGSNVLTITARDAAGNVATDVLTVTRTDGSAPVVKIATPTTNGNYNTAKAAVALSGTASDDASVTKVTWANSLGGNGTAAGTTAWSTGEIPLRAGANVITVTAFDAAGNKSTDVLTVTRNDDVPPVVEIVTPTSDPTARVKVAEIALRGTATDASGVTQVTWVNNRGGSGVAQGTTNWVINNVALKSGINVITVTARDAGGQTGADTITITVPDVTAPTIKIVAPTRDARFQTAAAEIALGGVAADNEGVTEVTWKTDKGASGVAVGTDAWGVARVPVAAGTTVVRVTATDAAGNSTTDVLTVTRLDSVAPTVEITTPTAKANFSTGSRSVVIGGRAADNTGVDKVWWTNSQGGGGIASGTTEWSATVPLKAGANVITVTAKDDAGNVSTDTLTIKTDDEDAPNVKIAAPAATATYSTNGTSVALGGSASDNVGVTEVRWVNNRGGNGVAKGTKNWAVNAVALKAGTNVITVTARDAAGNTDTDKITVTLDTKAPTLRLVSTAAEQARTAMVSTVNTVDLEGTTSDDFGPVRVTWTSDRGASGEASGDSRWTARGITLLPGVNVITVTARDAAGNSSTEVVRINQERGAPTISLTSPTTGAAYVSPTPAVALSGVAADETSVARVTWTTDKGQAGVAAGTTSWSIPQVALTPGATTVVTVTAHDNSGNTTSVSLAVTAADATAPVVKVFMPTTATSFTTSAASITIGGTATDNVGIAHVSWSNNQGGSGEMFGTTSWTALGIPLARGMNVITVTARDAAGNTGVAVLSVNSLMSSSQGAAK
jgi:hypothetical protein